MSEHVRSSRSLQSDLRYHRTRLLSDPNTSHLAVLCDGVGADLKERMQHSESAADAQVEASARRTACEVTADRACSQVEAIMLGEVGRNRQEPRYLECLPKGLSYLIALSGREQAEAMHRFVDKLTEQFPALAKRFGKELIAAADALASADDQHGKLMRVATMARADEQIARLGVSRQFDRNEAALYVIYPGDRKLVRSFFKPRTRKAPETPAEPVVGDDDENG